MREAAKRSLLPSPLQLTQIAAASGPTENPDAAIKNAVRLYLRAKRFCDEHGKDSLADLALAAGDTDLHRETMFRKYAEKNPNFPLEMDERTDGARRFLKTVGWSVKQARTVLENLEAFGKLSAMGSFLKDKGKMPTQTVGMTQREWDEEVKRQAVAAGWNESEWKEYEGQVVSCDQVGAKEIRVYPGFIKERRKERRNDAREVYVLNAALLSELVRWKKAIKQTGGKKSVTTAAQAEAQKNSSQSP